MRTISVGSETASCPSSRWRCVLSEVMSRNPPLARVRMTRSPSRWARPTARRSALAPRWTLKPSDPMGFHCLALLSTSATSWADTTMAPARPGAARICAMGASGAPAGIFARSALADQSVTAFPLASTRAMKLAGPSGRVVPPKAQICPSASSLAPCSPSQPTGMSFMVPASRSMTCSLASRSSRLLATQRRSLLSRKKLLGASRGYSRSLARSLSLCANPPPSLDP